MVTIRQLNFSVKGAATGPAKKTSDLPKEPIQAVSCLLELNRLMIAGNRTPKLNTSPMFTVWQKVAHAHTK